MKNNRGFSLIELLGVVAIIFLVITIATGSVIAIRNNTLKKSYDNLVIYLEAQAAKYANDTHITTVSVEELIKEGYVKPDDQTDVYDPQTNESMNCYIIKSTLKDGTFESTLGEDLGKEEGQCVTYEPTGLFNICSFDDVTGKCNDIGTNAWFKDDVTLGVKYHEGELLDNPSAQYNWTSTKGDSSTESTMRTSTMNVSQDTYKVEVTVDKEIGESSQKVNIDKQPPVILSVNMDAGWAPKKEVTVEATDMNGSGIKGYSFVGENDSCGEFSPSNKFTFTKEGTYKVCVSDNAGNVTTQTIVVEKIDDAVPVKPTITPSDGIDQNNWHHTDFTLSFSSIGEKSKSPIHYYYGTSPSNMNVEGSSVRINVNYNGKTIYVKACNEAGTCSDYNSYKIKYDNTPPTYVSGGSVGPGSISKPTYKDNDGGSGNVTVYTCVTSGNAPTSHDDACFSAINTTFDYNCGVTYKLYSYATDAAGNKSAIKDHGTSYYKACDPPYTPSGSGSRGGSSKKSGSTNTSSGGSYCDTTCVMKINSGRWDSVHNSNLPDNLKQSTQDAFHQTNVDLAKNNSDCGSGGCSYKNGTWYNSSGDKLYGSASGNKTGNNNNKSGSWGTNDSKTTNRIINESRNLIKKINEQRKKQGKK